MTCESCGDKPKKCNKDFTKAVIEIDNPEQITLMRKVTIPASMGDDTTVPPIVGKYKNVLLYYEANQKSYLYSSDGIPTQLVNGITDYEAAINLPQINNVTLIGNKSAADLKLADAPMVITVADGNTSWSGADTAEDVYNFFLNKGKVNIVFNGGENYAYEIASAAYIPEEEKMMCTLAVATIATGETAEFEGNALFGTMILHTDDKAIDVSQIELQPKLFVADFTGLDLNYDTLSGVPATNAAIGMVKAGDGLEVDTDGTLSISDIEQYAHFFDTVADMKQATNLIDGSYAQTYGFYSLNDGGGALYKIREKEENETANNITTFDIGTTNLVAEINEDVEINILQCGAKKDGSESISGIANYLITNYPTVDIYVPNGDYLVHETIYLGTATHFRGENMWQTRLFTDANIVMIQNKTDDIATLYMSNFYIDGDYHATKGVYIYRTQPNLVHNDSRSIIRDLLIKKCTDWCMQIGATTGSSNVIEITVENIYAHQYSGGGIYIAKCTDSHFSTLRAGSGMGSNKPGIQVEGYNLQFINCKSFLAGSVDNPASGWYFNGGGNIHADIEAQANTKNGVEIKNTRNSYFNIIADANCLANNNEQAIKLDGINACVVNANISNNVDTQGTFHTDVGCKIISPVKSTISLTCDNNIPKCVDLSDYNTSQLFVVNSKININGYPVVDVTPEFNQSITVPTGITLTKINNESFLLSGTSTTDQNIWLAGSYSSHTVLSKLSTDYIYNMSTGNSKVGLAVWDYVTNLGGGYNRIVEGSNTDVTAMIIQIKANTTYNHVITPKVYGLLNKPSETFA